MVALLIIWDKLERVMNKEFSLNICTKNKDYGGDINSGLRYSIGEFLCWSYIMSKRTSICIHLRCLKMCIRLSLEKRNFLLKRSVYI